MNAREVFKKTGDVARRTLDGAVAVERITHTYWRNQCVDRGVAHWEVDDRGESIFVWDYEPKGATP